MASHAMEKFSPAAVNIVENSGKLKAFTRTCASVFQELTNVKKSGKKANNVQKDTIEMISACASGLS